jgi:peptide/nickel transport system permease protein
VRAYIVRRLLLIIPTLFLASLIVFIIVRFIPGSIIDLMLAQHDVSASVELDRAAIQKALGLDVPIHVQYGRWMGNIILHGDLGNSLWSSTPVSDDIIAKMPVTFELGLIALIVALLIAFPIGIYSAIRQDTWGDYVGRSFAILCVAVPGFWIGTMVIVYGALWFDWSPPIELIPFVENPLENLKQFIIPAIVLGMALSGVTMRMTRTMMLEVLRQDYIRTAWSKGLRERIVIIRHALKNAMIPVITLIGLQLPVLVGGTVIIEQIFSLPGMGRLIVNATFERDYPIITGAMLFFATVVLLINLFVDLTYGWLDPRVQYK